MTKQQFLKRCETIYDLGLADSDTLKLLERWADIVMRFEGGQIWALVDFLQKESERTQRFGNHSILAGDTQGYKIIQIAAILTHPCQKCAEDKDAWHTRAAFCKHK